MDSEEDSSQLMDDDDLERVQFMSKYIRSKSLPLVYFPQHQQQQHAHHPVSPVDEYSTRKKGLQAIRENSTESDESQRRDSEFNSSVKNEEVRIIETNLKKQKGRGVGGCGAGDSIGQDHPDSKKKSDWRTLQQHYYPEGGWGWIITFCAVCCHAISMGVQIYLSNIVYARFKEGGWGFVILLTATSCHTFLCGIQLSFGILMKPIFNKFWEEEEEEITFSSGWLGALSLGISLFLSPVWVSICKRKSTRLSAVFGGLVASLGCLFTSFASQFHQLFISYGAFIGVGVGLTRDASTLMVGQYFKRKRELVEIVVVSGSGLGIALMSLSIHSAISSLGWRLGLQAITGSLFLTFFLSTCYRSASLYHPQRRAILHLKNQKRKIKEREKREERPPLIDYSCLRSKTLQILLLSSAFISFGIYNPLFSLAEECTKPGFEGCSLVLLHVYVGVSWILGCLFLGLLVIQKSQDCRVSKQYLTQVASVICGISILAFTSVKGNNGIVVFSWIYGFSLGGYNYALKVYTYERVRARHFPRAWSFVQSVQAIPLVLGVPISNQINQTVGWRYGYLLSAITIFIGAACLFLTDVRKRRMSRRKALSQNSSMKTCETTDGTSHSPKSKRLSFSFPAEVPLPQANINESDDEDDPGGGVDPSVMIKELTCISEEGIADMDFQDIYFDEWAEYFGECITSCNKVEDCLHSEYDPDYAVLVERRARRWSAARQNNVNATESPTKSIPMVGRKGTKTTSKLLGVPMLNPKLFQLNLRRSQSSNSQDGDCSPHCSANNAGGTTTGAPSTAAAALGVEVVRAVPFIRSHIISPAWPSCSSSSSATVKGKVTTEYVAPIGTILGDDDEDDDDEENIDDFDESM